MLIIKSAHVATSTLAEAAAGAARQVPLDVDSDAGVSGMSLQGGTLLHGAKQLDVCLSIALPAVVVVVALTVTV